LPFTVKVSLFAFASSEFHSGHVRNGLLDRRIARATADGGDPLLDPIAWDIFGTVADVQEFQR
jgi:hypothetical protein